MAGACTYRKQRRGQRKLRGEQKAELLQLADQRLKLELAPRPLPIGHRLHHDKNVRVAQPIPSYCRSRSRNNQRRCR